MIPGGFYEKRRVLGRDIFLKDLYPFRAYRCRGSGHRDLRVGIYGFWAEQHLMRIWSVEEATLNPNPKP